MRFLSLTLALISFTAIVSAIKVPSGCSYNNPLSCAFDYAGMDQLSFPHHSRKTSTIMIPKNMGDKPNKKLNTWRYKGKGNYDGSVYECVQSVADEERFCPNLYDGLYCCFFYYKKS